MSIPDESMGDLDGLIASLRTVKPAAPGIDRDRLLYEAGRRSVRRPRLWQAATVAASLLALGMGLVWYGSAPSVRDHVVYVPVPGPANVPRGEPVSESVAVGFYPVLREAALRTGETPRPPTLDLDPVAQPVLTAGSYAARVEEGHFLPGRNNE